MDGNSQWYVIRVGCQLDARWAGAFEGMAVTNLPGGEAEIVGPLVDQAALHGILAKIRDMNMPLISVARSEGGESYGPA